MQPWPALLEVAQGNLAGSLEERAKYPAGGYCWAACECLLLSLQYLKVALDAVLSVQYPPTSKYAHPAGE